MRANATVKECDECGTLCPNPGHWNELDRCLCCGKELCDWCRQKHGRIATEKKRKAGVKINYPRFYGLDGDEFD